MQIVRGDKEQLEEEAGGKQVEGGEFWLVCASEAATAAARPGRALGKARGYGGAVQKAKPLSRCRDTGVVVTLQDRHPGGGHRAAPRPCAGPRVGDSFSIILVCLGFFSKAEAKGVQQRQL